MKILISGACAVSARSVLRSLKMSPFFKDSIFIGWDMCSLLYGVYAGEFDRLYRVPPVSSAEYENVVDLILEKEKPDAAILVPEVEVLYWARKGFPIPCLLPPPHFSEIAISKERLFDNLVGSGIIPKSFLANRDDFRSNDFNNPLGYPVWIRDGSAGTASAKGAFKANSREDLIAWSTLNPGITHFQLSEFLPGKNYGCFCLFYKGKLMKLCQAERIEYIMSKVSMSGITGNTAKGRLLNDERMKNVALMAIERICEITSERMNGLVVVDLKCNSGGDPIVTEINLRHVAYSSIFASAGFNISEYQLLLALGRLEEMTPDIEISVPKDNMMLRDVDGLPIYVKHLRELKVGEYYSKYNEIS